MTFESPLPATAMTGRALRFPASALEILQNAQAREWYHMMHSGQAMEAAFAIVNAFSQGNFRRTFCTSRATQPIGRDGRASSR